MRKSHNLVLSLLVKPSSLPNLRLHVSRKRPNVLRDCGSQWEAHKRRRAELRQGTKRRRVRPQVDPIFCPAPASTGTPKPIVTRAIVDKKVIDFIIDGSQSSRVVDKVKKSGATW